MEYIKGQNRAQTTVFPVSLDDDVDAENEVRLINVFVDSLKLEEFGFRVHIENVRPAYHLANLLKHVHLRVFEQNPFVAGTRKRISAKHRSNLAFEKSPPNSKHCPIF